MPLRLGRLTDAEVGGFLKAHLKPAPSSRELEQRVSLAEGSIGAALRAGDEAGKAQQAAALWLEAVLAGPGPSFERALKQTPWAARGEFTAMLDALADTLGEAARGTLGQPVRRTVPKALLRLSGSGSTAQGHGACGRCPRGGMGKREPAGPAGRPGRRAGRGPVKLSHLDERGRARMVDVGGKPESERTAAAEGVVRMSREAFDLVAAQAVAKGDVLAVAEVAGAMGGQAYRRIDPALSPSRPGSDRGGGAAGAGAAWSEDHRGGQGNRPHRSGDGGAHRGRDSVSHGVRHG